MKTNTLADRQRGVMFGLAYGDALGRPTEFMKASSLVKFGSPFKPWVGLNKPHQGIVTDDTQMSIAVAKAALVTGPLDPKMMADRFAMAFVNWYDDPKSKDGKRAPGSTCLSAAGKLKRNPRQWLLATDPDSKGNGANMRVAPLALRTDWTWDEMAAAAQLQAAITHGHATALAAADLTATAVRMLLEGVAKPTESLLDHLLAYANDQRSKYHGDWLGHLWQPVTRSRPSHGWQPDLWQDKAASKWWDEPATVVARGNWWDDAEGKLPAVKPPSRRHHRRDVKSPQEFIERGWDKMIDTLIGIYGIPRDKWQDPCDVAGGGWVAEEAIAGALHTLLCFPDNPTDALRRAAFTDGDSDSIASITGALAGAAYGRAAFPAHWVGNVEYRAELESLSKKLGNAATC